MSKNVALFIDVANIYYAARGQDVDVDYVALLKHITKGRDLIRAYAYSGLDPENENQRKFLDFLSKNNYKVVHKDIRKFGDGRVKANLDIELVVDLFRLANRMDIAVIVSGDGDFASAIRALQDGGVRCEVISFRPNTSSDLIAVADEFTDIMKIAGISRKRDDKGMSMPEMPAKEVNPEFGFREASRGVAAAALAAIREGEKPAGRTRRGRTTRTAAEHPAAEPAAPHAAAPGAAAPRAAAERPEDEAAAEPGEPLTALEAHVEPTDGEPRRRRRRRGGRGRGRGRRQEGELEASVPTGGEIRWEEFDDLSQLGELTDLGEPGREREFEFQEADESTLAELGLGIEPAAGPEAATPRAELATEPRTRRQPAPRRRGRGPATAAGEAPAEENEPPQPPSEPGAVAPRPSRRRRATSATTETGASVEPATASGEAPVAPEDQPPRRARARRPKAAPAEAPAAEEGSDATSSRPARARRTRSRAASSAALSTGDGEGGDQQGEAAGEEGIWQRFKSGRRPTSRKS